MGKIIYISLFLIVTLATADLLGLVYYPKYPSDAILCSVRFDDKNKILAIDKIYSDGREIDRKAYFFVTKVYTLGLIKDFKYSCKTYDSILDDYFTLEDITVPTIYNSSMSRALSIFFSGSWAGENVTRNSDTLVSEYWRMDILAHNSVVVDLIKWTESCSSL